MLEAPRYVWRPQSREPLCPDQVVSGSWLLDNRTGGAVGVDMRGPALPASPLALPTQFLQPQTARWGTQKILTAPRWGTEVGWKRWPWASQHFTARMAPVGRGSHTQEVSSPRGPTHPGIWTREVKAE